MKLITDPPIIFCDEPTTGLDTFNAISVVESLKQLSTSENTLFDSIDSPRSNRLTRFGEISGSNGNNNNTATGRKAIMCSIHQPTSDIFRCFSHIILMHAGHSIFQGSVEETADFFSRLVLGSPSRIDFFFISIFLYNRLGFQCPAAYNPAEYYVDVISRGDHTAHGSKALENPIEIIQKEYKYKPRSPSRDFFPIEWHK